MAHNNPKICRKDSGGQYNDSPITPIPAFSYRKSHPFPDPKSFFCVYIYIDRSSVKNEPPMRWQEWRVGREYAKGGTVAVAVQHDHEQKGTGDGDRGGREIGSFQETSCTERGEGGTRREDTTAGWTGGGEAEEKEKEEESVHSELVPFGPFSKQHRPLPIKRGANREIEPSIRLRTTSSINVLYVYTCRVYIHTYTHVRVLLVKCDQSAFTLVPATTRAHYTHTRTQTRYIVTPYAYIRLTCKPRPGRWRLSRGINTVSLF